MTLGRRHLLFVVAVAFAAATAGGLYLSLGTIRDTVQFNRILRRIDPADPDPSLLEEAAGFAQSREDWRTLLGLAWEIDNRAGTLGYLATEASRRFPSEPIWRSIAAFAALEREDRSSARQLMSVRAEGAEADELEEWMMLLARVQPEDPRGSRSALRELLSGAGLFPRSSAVAAAEINRDPASFQQAWQATAVGAFALQGALEAAEAGNSVLARSLIDAARGDSRLPGAERWNAPLYLALWLDDTEWLFEELQSMPGLRIGEAPVLLVQAEGHRRQGRLREARRFYRELQVVAPGYSDLAFLNDAALTWVLGDGRAAPVLRAGLDVHPDSARIRGELAGLLVLEDERLAAVRLLGEQVLNSGGTAVPAEQAHRDWLLTRAVLGSRRPLERLESDLWAYLNNNPGATVVARYLARFLALRMDQAGMVRLAERYPLEFAPWARPLHAAQALAVGNREQAESLLFDASATRLVDWYNRALFALRYLPLPEAERSLADARAWLEGGAAVSPAAFDEFERSLLVLEAEYARLAGDSDTARRRVERALLIRPDAELRAYRAILASP